MLQNAAMPTRCETCGCLPIEWLSTREVARVLGVTERTVRNRIACGELAATMFGCVWRVRHAELDRYVIARSSMP